MKPSDFVKVSNMGSIFQNHEAEVVAANVMKILSRTGDNFRLMSWTEYRTEREKDGDFTTREQRFFEDVAEYCANSHGAAAFAPGWAQLAMRFASSGRVQCWNCDKWRPDDGGDCSKCGCSPLPF